MSSALRAFCADLDDEQYFKRVESAIQQAIEQKKSRVFLDLDWWKPGLKRLGTDPISSYMLFAPGTGMIEKRATAVLVRCQQQFPAHVLVFGGCDGGSMCVISERKPQKQAE